MVPHFVPLIQYLGHTQYIYICINMLCMYKYIYIHCMYTNLKYFSFKACKASRVERTSFTKAYRPRWWCPSRASWTFMWQAFHARSWSGGSSWSCRNTVPTPVIRWSVKYIVCTYTFQAWQNWLSTVLKTLTEDRWIVFRTDIFQQISVRLHCGVLWSWQCLQDFSILNSNRPCLQGPHASTFHGVVGSLSKNIALLLLRRS